MWTKSENSENLKPLTKELSGNTVILRRNIKRVDATDETPEHYTWDEWQMTAEQYEVYQYHENMLNEQSDALMELAALISEVV